jgi:NADPH-dependent ferric siderophore reductase
VLTAFARPEDAPRSVPIVLHADAPDATWIAAQLENANALFAPAGLSFSIAETVPSTPARPLASIDDRAARDALADDVAMSPRGEPAQVNVFLTDRLIDVDDPPSERMGVHWRRRRHRAVHYVIVSRRAWPTTLAHELGHYFGNPHSRTPNNIMSYERDGATPPFFDAAQLARIRSHARRYVRAGLEAR